MEGDIREQLRHKAAEVAALKKAYEQSMEERVELVLKAFEYGLQPGIVQADAGLSHSRIYQIRAKASEVYEDPTTENPD